MSSAAIASHVERPDGSSAHSHAAKSNGVRPSRQKSGRDFRFASAPWSSNHFATRSLPWPAARCSIVTPSGGQTSASAGWDSNTAITASSPPDIMACRRRWKPSPSAFAPRAPRFSSCATIIATISSYPRSSAMVRGLVASRLGQMPPRVSAPDSSSSRVISTSRCMTAMWRARISKPEGPPRIRSTISGRRARSARAAPRSPFCTASCNLVVVTPATAAFSFGQLSNPYERASTNCASWRAKVSGVALRWWAATSMTASGD